MTLRTSNGYPFTVLAPEPALRTGIELRVYDGQDPGTLIDVLPDTRNRQWLDELNGEGSGSFEIRADADAILRSPNVLAYGNIVRVWLDGILRHSWRIEAISRTEIGAGDDAARWLTVTGRGSLAVLEDCIVYPGGGVGGATPRTFIGTPGGVMEILLLEAQARGVATDVQIDFTSSTDSVGSPFLETLNLEEDAGVDLLRVAQRHAELGVDVYMTPLLKLQYFNERGVDRTLQTVDTGPVILRPALNVEELTTEEAGVIKNVLLIEIPGGFVERQRGDSITTHGRREAFLTLGNVVDNLQINTAADAAFARTAEPVESITLTIEDVDGARPYVDWNVGDWVYLADLAGGLTRYRVRSISVSEDPNTGRPIFTPELANVAAELEDRLTRWLKAMSRGTLGGVASAIAEPNQASVTTVTTEATTIAEDTTDAALADHLATQPHFDELADLTDVDLTGLTDADMLRYDAGAGDWTPTPLELPALDDVDPTGAGLGDALRLNGSGIFVPAAAPGVMLRRTTNQSLASATWEPVAWESEDYDDDGFAEQVTNPTRVTFARAGRYLVTANVLIASSATGRRIARFRINGSTVVGSVGETALPTGYSGRLSLTRIVAVSASDYLELEAYQDSGGAIDLIGDPALETTRLEVTRL